MSEPVGEIFIRELPDGRRVEFHRAVCYTAHDGDPRKGWGNVTDEVLHLRAERDEWMHHCNHAKRQRDRAIVKANSVLGDDVEPWHPDDEGTYDD